MSNSNPNPETQQSRPTGSTEQLAEKVHKGIDAAAEKAQQTEQKLRQSASEAQEKFRDLSDKAQQSAEQNLHKVESFIREKPLTSAGIALAAGVVLSSLLKRH